MAKLFGAQRLVLQSIQDSHKDAAGFVSDAEIARGTKIALNNVLDWIKTLEGEGHVEVARTTEELRVSITARGRLALRQDDRPFSDQDVDRIGLAPSIELLDRTIRLGRTPELELESRYFSLIDRIYEQFVSVHEAYLDHFRKYRELVFHLQGSIGRDSLIFDTLQNDHLFSETDRLRLRAMTEAMPKIRLEGRGGISAIGFESSEQLSCEIMNFLQAVRDYFMAANHYDGDNCEWGNCMPRMDLLLFIKLVFDLRKADLQHNFWNIIHLWPTTPRDTGLSLSVTGNRWEQLQVELQAAESDPDRIKKSLALAKIDEIVEVLLKKFGQISLFYQLIKVNPLSLSTIH